jgi:acetyl esterase
MTPAAGFPLPQDPEVLAYMSLSASFYPADAFQSTVAQARTWYDRYAAAMAQPFPDGIHTQDFWVEGARTGQQRPARRYSQPQGSPVSGATVLYVHGGGFVLGGLESHADVCAGLCNLSGLEVVACTYRLAPEHVHPAQLDDVERAYQALLDRDEQVILCGDSAGANLVAGLGVRLQASGRAPALGQVLIYPALGGDTTQGSYLSRAQAPMLSAEECASYFAARAQGLSPAQSRHPELRPLLATDLSGMPPTLVVTADIDPLRDDGAVFAQRLQDLGIRVQYRNEPELVHGYLRARHMSRRAAASFQAMADGLKKMADGSF